MRKELGWSFGRIPCAQKSYLVEENVETRVERDKPLYTVILSRGGLVHRRQSYDTTPPTNHREGMGLRAGGGEVPEYRLSQWAQW